MQSEARQLFSGTTLGHGLWVNPAGLRKAGLFPGDQGGFQAGKEEKRVRVKSTGPDNARPDRSGDLPGAAAGPGGLGWSRTGTCCFQGWKRVWQAVSGERPGEGERACN